LAGRKNKDKSAGGKPGRFHQDPFKKLKGFSVSAPPEKLMEKIDPHKRDRPARTVSASEDDASLFAEEMSRLGVKGKRAEEGSLPEKPSAEADMAPAPPPASDQELFLEALKGMDTVFEDSFPPEEEAQASPRRMKLLRQGRLIPEAKLDLHGLTREEARAKVRYFLDDSVYHGKKTVLIVTGRGKGSGGEPVLRGEVERYLADEAGAWVSEWGRAPARYGGEGALVIFLKGNAKREG